MLRSSVTPRLLPAASPRGRTVLTVLVVAALASPWIGCVSTFFPGDSTCYGFTLEDPLMEIHLDVLKEPLRYGAAHAAAESLLLVVGSDGMAGIFHRANDRILARSHCRPLAADDLAEVMRAVERLERSVVAERRLIRPGCRDMTRIVLRGDPLLRTFFYCGTTPPAEVVRFVEEVSEPLARRFGEKLAKGLAATAPWVSPVPGDPPAGP